MMILLSLSVEAGLGTTLEWMQPLVRPSTPCSCHILEWALVGPGYSGEVGYP